jgi:DNA-binding helix-hairpin-helix protein with protein kinase domain
MNDPLLTALTTALAGHGITDPAAVTAAANAAVSVLGRDRCVCQRAIHSQHHHSPVPGCPWCTPAQPPQPARPGTDDVPTRGLL